MELWLVQYFSSFAALKVFAFDSHHMKHIHPHVYTGGDYIKISPKKREEFHPNGKKQMLESRWVVKHLG